MAQNASSSVHSPSATSGDDSKPQVCPVVGTLASSLPLNHPPVDLSEPGQICPVVGAKTEHHAGLLHAHPPVDVPPGTDPNDATLCPALSKMVRETEAQKLDEAICPVAGTATTILPPGHPVPDDKNPDAMCPVTKATTKHHLGKVNVHPDVDSAPGGAVCPVVGAKA